MSTLYCTVTYLESWTTSGKIVGRLEEEGEEKEEAVGDDLTLLTSATGGFFLFSEVVP